MGINCCTCRDYGEVEKKRKKEKREDKNVWRKHKERRRKK